jgi:arylsulfatase A
MTPATCSKSVELPCLPQHNRRNLDSLSMKSFNPRIALLVVAGFCLVGTYPSHSFGAQTRKPNIIFILADDLGYGDLGCYGQKRIKTPNIDELAQRGTRFTQFYAGSTVCAPSRCALMTGKHAGHGRIRGNGGRGEGGILQADDVTVPKILKQAGYRTAIIGKWGLGNQNTPGVPNRQGFDYSFGYLGHVHAHEYWTDHLFRNGERVEIPPKTYSHDLFAEEALDFVRREHDKPFFLYLAFTIPHAKFNPPTDAPYSNEDWSPQDKNLAAMMTRMDNDIGKLMSLLKELNLENDTIVFFTSDNGPREQGTKLFQSAGPLRGIKRDLYEGGIREPMIVHWPGKVKAGATSAQVWTFWDVLPTLAEIAGVKSPEEIDGISMLSALLGQNQSREGFLYWEFHERGFDQAVRTGDWKAVRHGKDPLELFDLSTDPGESRNIARQNPNVVAKIEEYLETARSDSAAWPIKERPRRKRRG